MLPPAEEPDRVEVGLREGALASRACDAALLRRAAEVPELAAEVPGLVVSLTKALSVWWALCSVSWDVPGHTAPDLVSPGHDEAGLGLTLSAPGSQSRRR